MLIMFAVMFESDQTVVMHLTLHCNEMIINYNSVGALESNMEMLYVNLNRVRLI